MTLSRLIPERTALLFFDCLKGYLRPEDPEARAAIDASGMIPALQRIERAARQAGIPIFYTQVDHRPDEKDIAPLIADWDRNDQPGPDGGPVVVGGTLATPGTWRQEVIDEIAPQPQDYILRKQRWSAFYQTNFLLHLRRLAVDTILIAGGNTEIGVISTAYSARDRDFNTVILRDACRSPREGVNDFLADRIFPIFCRVMTVNDAIRLIGPAA